MQEVWIIDTARSPRGLGRADKGSLATLHPQRLLSQILVALKERNHLTAVVILQGPSVATSRACQRSTPGGYIAAAQQWTTSAGQA